MESRLARLSAAVVISITTMAAQVAAIPKLSTGLTAAIQNSKAAMLVDPRTAIAKAQAASVLVQPRAGLEHNVGLATLQWLQAEAFVRLNDANNAKPLIGSAIALLSNSPDSKLKGDMLITRGGYFSLTGNAADALIDYQAAYNVYVHTQDERSQSLALIDIANLYTFANDFERAVRYYKQAADIYSADRQLAFFIYCNLGQAYQDLRDYPKARLQLKAALKISEEIGNVAMMKRSLRVLAQIDLAQGKLAEADAWIGRALRLQHSTADDEDEALTSVAAQAAFQHGSFKQATILIERSFAGVDIRHTTHPFRARHETAYAIYRRSGDTAKALAHLEAMKRLDDEAARLATSTNAALMGARFDFANQELRIAKMRQAEAAARAHTARQVSIGIGVGTSLIIAVLIIALLAIRRSRDEVRRANGDLARINEALETALKIKTEFLATTSHEIRTPLNGILGMAQVMLADPTLEATTRERVDVVLRAGETMRALVDDILDIAKLETGKLRVESVTMDLRATMSGVARLWEDQAGAKGLRFNVDLEDCPAQMLGDPVRLRQVLGNLLSNAVKFTLDGEVTLRTECIRDATPRIRISVGDTGIGIAAETQDLVFESFRQADASTTRRFGGTGLGLAICRQLARAMDGDVTVISEIGRGSTFTLELPLREAPAVVRADAPPVFLVVEANPIARATYRALLGPHVSALAFAASADDAVAVIARGGVARVLADDRSLALDVGPDGLERLLAAADQAGVPTALLWTANAEQADVVGKHLSDERIITKPVAKSELVQRLFGNVSYLQQPLVSRAA